MKKILNFLMVMLLVMGLGMASVMTAFQAEAAETAETAGETVSAAETVLTANQDGETAADASMSASGIYDAADLLSADEEASLLTKLEKYSERYSADIAIVTTDDAGGLSAQAYADAYAEKIGQSMSRDEYPGILFLIDAFLKGVRDYMGRSTDRSARMDAFGVLLRLIIAIVIGAVVTFAMVFRRGGRVTTNSRTYFDASGSHLDAKEDRFMNRTVTRRHIEKPKGGGGVHMSSGGGTHGGGGRSF